MQFLAEAIIMNIKDGHSFEQHYDSLKQLREELKPTSGETEQLAVLLADMHVRFPIGTEVDINGTGYTGVVVYYNVNLGGFYQGIRYPLNIKITKQSANCKHDAVGKIFEYQPDQIFRIDLLEQAYDDLINDRVPTDDQQVNIEYIRCRERLLK